MNRVSRYIKALLDLFYLPGNRCGSGSTLGLRGLPRLQPGSARVPAMLRTRRTHRTAMLGALSRSGRCSRRAYSTTGKIQTSLRDNHTTPPSEHTSTATTAETHVVSPAPGQTQAQSTLNSAPSIDLEALQSRLRDWSVLATSSLRQRADHLSKKATTTFSDLGQHLNRVTGYEEIEMLKRRVVEQGTVLHFFYEPLGRN